jgi:hypothetical protein
MSDPTETVALAVQVANNLPPGVSQNLGASLSALLGAAVDVPVAWLEGKAKAIRAKADAEVNVVRALGHKAAELLPADPELQERTKQSFVSRLFRSQLNKEAIAKKVQQELCDTPPTIDAGRQIDADWLDMYSRIAETKSNEEMQTYFARLLAGEIRKPGSFSPATIEVLSRLTPESANVFYRLCNISCTIAELPSRATAIIVGSQVAVITSPYGLPGANALQPLGFPYATLCDLQDAGLIRSDLNATWSPKVFVFLFGMFCCAGERLRFQEPLQPETTTMDAVINCGAILFTRAGTEIRRLLELQPNKEYLTKLQEWLAKELKPYGLTNFSGEAECMNDERNSQGVGIGGTGCSR